MRDTDRRANLCGLLTPTEAALSKLPGKAIPGLRTDSAKSFVVPGPDHSCNPECAGGSVASGFLFLWGGSLSQSLSRRSLSPRFSVPLLDKMVQRMPPLVPKTPD